MISPEAPYPLAGGGALRTASLVEYLSKSYELDLIVFELPGKNSILHLPPSLQERAKAITLVPHRRDTAAKIWRNFDRLVRHAPPLVDRYSGYENQMAELLAGNRYSVAVLEHFWAASYIAAARNVSDSVVMDLHNVESEWHEASARAAAWPPSLAYRRFARAARVLERVWLPQCSLVLTASEEDAARVANLARESLVYPNAIPWCNVPQVVEEFPIAFSGNLEYEPNRVALKFFLRRVWPLLTAEMPALRFRIIGKNEHAVRSIVSGIPGVECSGPVDDAVTELARAAVVVAPLLSGSGTRLKIVEAWAAQRAVVSTTIGAEGLGAQDGQTLLLADSAREFANAILSLLRDVRLRVLLATNGRALYEEQFTWNAAWKRLDRAF